MALIQCKECSATIAENAEFCPKCGNKYDRPKKRNWADVLVGAIPGSIVISAATAVLAYLTFFYQKDTQENQKLEAMIESAVSDNVVQERTAIQVVSYLAKENKLSPKFALSILGTVVRNITDEQLRSEIYDAVETLTGENSSGFLDFDKYEQLEVFCLQAALTPAQKLRQTNLYAIEVFVGSQTKDFIGKVKGASDGLRLQAASKLLSLTQQLSDPQAIIDLLMSACACDSDPDMIEKVIPYLCQAVKSRGNNSNKDVLGRLVELTSEIGDSTKTATGGKADVRDANRSQIRLYLARAIIANDKGLRDDSLGEFEKIVTAQNLYDDARLLLDAVARTTQNPNLPTIAAEVSNYLAGENNVGSPKVVKE
jgi:hypothetical protein